MTEYFPFDTEDAKSFLAATLPNMMTESLSDEVLAADFAGFTPYETLAKTVPAHLPPLERNQALSSALLPLLHALLDRYGYIDDQVVPILAEMVNRSRAEIHGVVTFYHDFRRTPPGKTIIRICLAEACQSMGSDSLASSAKKQFHADFHHNSADEKYRLEPVYCFGNCACAPAVMVDDRLYGRATPEKLTNWVKNAANSAPGRI